MANIDDVVLDLAVSTMREKRLPSPGDRPGYIYVVKMGTLPVYKIGRTKSLEDRRRIYKVLLPVRIDLICAIPTSDIAWAEAWIHNSVRHFWLNGEWFMLNDERIEWFRSIEYIKPFHINPFHFERIREDDEVGWEEDEEFNEWDEAFGSYLQHVKGVTQ
jgi:hypothetical protein